MTAIYSEPMSSLPVSSTTDQMLAGLVAVMRGKVVQGIRIHDAMAKRDFDYWFEPMVSLGLLLDNPKPGLATWPVEATFELRHVAWREAERLSITDWVQLSYAGLDERERSVFASPEGYVR